MEKRLRLARLRELAAEVHRLPRSGGRDQLLRTLRSGAVNIDARELSGTLGFAP
jgi:hypothetical protein